MFPQFFDCHPIYSWRSLVLFHPFQRSLNLTRLSGGLREGEFYTV
jgi:hypothetical protein